MHERITVYRSILLLLALLEPTQSQWVGGANHQSADFTNLQD